MKKSKVLLLENIHQQAKKYFLKQNFQVELLSGAIDRHKLIKKINDVVVLGVRSKTILDREILLTAKNLKAIGVFCVGMDKIDLDFAKKQDIKVINAPFSNTRSVAELAIGEMIMLLRKAAEKNIQLHRGEWNKEAVGCYEIRNKRLGIIGYGNIGGQLSILAEGLGMKVFFYDVADRMPIGNAVKCENLAELLRRVDIVSLHIDGRQGNKNFISKEEMEIMNDGVYILNLSRGFVLDHLNLVRFLDNKKISGVAIDVYPEEPKSNTENFISELRRFNNVILTPHIGGSTEEAQINIANFVGSKIINYLNSN